MRDISTVEMTQLDWSFMIDLHLWPVLQLFDLTPETYRSVLSALITAQAGILAIVISVTLIAVQLVVSKYAPRMGIVPFRTKAFRWTFYVFSVSILYDIVALAVADLLTPSTRFLALGTAIVLVGAVGYRLYRSIGELASLSTPERLVTHFANLLTGDQYLKDVRAYREQPESNPHPLQSLFRFIISTIDNRESGAAAAALSQYRTLTHDLLDELAEDGGPSDEDAGNSKLYDFVLKTHLHDITLHAAEANERQLVETAIDTVKSLGQRGMELDSPHGIPHSAHWSLRLTINRAPVTPDDSATLNFAWPAYGELVESAVEHDSRVLLSQRNTLQQRLHWSIRRTDRENLYREALDDLFSSICTAHNQQLERVDADMGHNLGFLDSEAQTDESRDQPIERLSYLVGMVAAAASAFLGERIEDGAYPITEGNYMHQWVNLILEAAETGHRRHATRLCQIFIELAYLENVEGPYEADQYGPLGNRIERESPTIHGATLIQRIRERTDSSIVDDAFETMLDYEARERQDPLIIVDDWEQEQRENYRFTVDVGDYYALNQTEDYPELLEELRESSRSSE